jgi:hypothetical protein
MKRPIISEEILGIWFPIISWAVVLITILIKGNLAERITICVFTAFTILYFVLTYDPEGEEF